VLDLQELGERAQALSEELAAGGLRVPCDEPPALFTPIELALVLDAGLELVVTGQVVNPMPGGFFMVLDPGQDTRMLELALQVALEQEDQEVDLPQQESAPEPEAVPSEGPEAEADPDSVAFTPVWQLIDQVSGVPLRRQIQDLSVRDRLRLATHANRPMRNILVRDIEKRVHVNVIKNPKITDAEVLEYASIPTLSPNALRWISTQVKYTRRSEVRMKLIMNPQMPKDTAIKLMTTLSVSQLRRLMRSSRVREAIQRAARKKLMDQGIL